MIILRSLIKAIVVLSGADIGLATCWIRLAILYDGYHCKAMECLGQNDTSMVKQLLKPDIFFIVSIAPNAKIFANAVRKHWAIENQLLWVLDVSFREDNPRVRRDNASENFGVFRNVAVNALRHEKSCKKGIKAKRYKATLEPDYAQKVLDGIF